MTDADPDDLLDVHEIAARLGVDDQYVRDMLRNGTIPGEKVFHEHARRWGWAARRRDVEAHLATRSAPPARHSEARPDDPMRREFDVLNAQIAAAESTLGELKRQLNRRIVAWSEQGRSYSQIGDAVGMSKQGVGRIRNKRD